jgi:hypothetical protein
LLLGYPEPFPFKLTQTCFVDLPLPAGFRDADADAVQPELLAQLVENISAMAKAAAKRAAEKDKAAVAASRAPDDDDDGESDDGSDGSDAADEDDFE